MNIYSFGWSFAEQYPLRYAIPDADLVLDVRPVLDHEINDICTADRTGLELEVRECIMINPYAQELVETAFDYITNKNSSGSIAFGCVFGKHRSVSLAIELGERLERENYLIEVKHLSFERGFVGEDEE